MTRLSTLSRYLAAYLKVHGDKEVLSVASHYNDKDCDLSVDMADIHDGPIGTNPYKGRDELRIPTGDAKEDDLIFAEEDGVTYEKGYNDGYDRGYREGCDNAVSKTKDADRVTTGLFAAISILSFVSLVAKWKKK